MYFKFYTGKPFLSFRQEKANDKLAQPPNNKAHSVVKLLHMYYPQCKWPRKVTVVIVNVFTYQCVYVYFVGIRPISHILTGNLLKYTESTCTFSRYFGERASQSINSIWV